MIRLCAFYLLVFAVCKAQSHDWQSLSGLQPGDKVRLSLNAGKSVTGIFRSWTPESATVGATTARKDEVRKLERFREGAMGRGKRSGIGAIIGFGGGFAIGAATSGGCHVGVILCFGRGTVGAAVGLAGAVIGAGIGAIIPAHTKDVIYANP